MMIIQNKVRCHTNYGKNNKMRGRWEMALKYRINARKVLQVCEYVFPTRRCAVLQSIPVKLYSALVANKAHGAASVWIL